MCAPAPAAGLRAPSGRDGPGQPAVDRGLARRQRLTRSKSFEEAFAQGGSVAGRCLVLWPRRGAGAALRLGVVASRRTFHDAVLRSRAKRLLREAYRLNRHRFAAGCDVVLVARRRILEAKRADVERDLLDVARRARLLGRANEREAAAGGEAHA